MFHKNKYPFKSLVAACFCDRFPIRKKNHTFCKGLPNEHSYHVWFQSAQRFQRRRLECKNLQTTMMMTDTKVTTTPYMIFWVRWPKKKIGNYIFTFYFAYIIHCTKLHMICITVKFVSTKPWINQNPV
jgi:hypothetical protein